VQCVEKKHRIIEIDHLTTSPPQTAAGETTTGYH
jgi:hypothetical protein